MFLRRSWSLEIGFAALMLIAAGCGGDTITTPASQTAPPSTTTAPSSASTVPEITTGSSDAPTATEAPGTVTTPPTTEAESAPETTEAPVLDDAAPVSFRGIGRSGRFPGPAPQEAPGLAWTFFGQGVAALPVLGGGVAFTQDTVAVTALDLATGKVIWSTALPTSDPRTPALNREAVIALSVPEPYEDDSGWHPGNVTEVIGLDPGDGNELWRTPVESLVHVSPLAIHEDVLVIVGTGDLLWSSCGDLCYPDGWVIAFDARTGEELWRLAANSPRTVSVVEGTVVVPFDNSTLTAYDLATGEEVWSTVHCTGLLGPPAITAGRVVLATFPGGVPFPPCLQAFDLRTGDELWRSERSEIDGFWQPLLVLTATAYLGDEQGMVAVDAATGEELWRIDGLVGQPTMVGPQIIVDGFDAEQNRIMVGLRPADGQEIWRLDVEGEDSFWGVVAADGIVIRTEGGTLQAFAVGP